MANQGVGDQVFELRPLNIADLLDQVIRIYRRRFGELIGITAVIVIPLAIVRTLMAVFMEPGPELDEFPISTEMLVALGGGDQTGIVGLLAWLAMPLMQAAIAMAVSEYYLGGEASLGGAYRFAARRWLTLIGVALLTAIVLWVATVAVMVPAGVALGIGMSVSGVDAAGIALIGLAVVLGLGAMIVMLALWTRLFFAALAVVLENRRAVDSLKRSWGLTMGHFWRVLGALLVIGLLVLIAQAIIVLPAFLALTYLEIPGPESLTVVGLSAIGSVAQLITIPLQIIATVLLYYDLRIRKEGFDLAMMAAAIGQPERVQAVPAAEAREPLFGAPGPGPPEALPPPPPAPPEMDEAPAAEPPPTGAARDRPPSESVPPPAPALPSDRPPPPPVPEIPEEPDDEPGDRPELPGT